MELNSRNNKKIQSLGIDIDELIKYKKSIYIKNITIIFLILYFIINIFIQSVGDSPNSHYIDILFILYMITSYILVLGYILKTIRPNSCITNCLYSPKYLNKLINNKDLQTIDPEKLLEDEKLDTKNISQDEVLSVRNLVNTLELNFYSKYFVAATFIVGVLIAISVYTNTDTSGNIIDYNTLLLTMLTGTCAFLFLIAIITFTGNSSIKIQAKLQSKIADTVEMYYQLGCLDATDYALIRENYKFVDLKYKLNKYTPFEILDDYNISKMDLLKTYLEINTRKKVDMSTSILVLILILISVIFIKISSVIWIAFGAALSKIAKSIVEDITESRYNALYSDKYKLNKLLDKIYSNEYYFYYYIHRTITKR